MGEETAMANWENHTPDSFLEFCMKTFPQDTFKVSTDYEQVIYIQPARIDPIGELEEIGDNMTLAQVKMLIDSIQYSENLFVWTSEAKVSNEANQEIMEFDISPGAPADPPKVNPMDIPGYVPPEETGDDPGALEPAPVTPQTAAIKANHPAQVSEKIEMLVLENKDLKTSNDQLTIRVQELEKENSKLKDSPPPPPPPDDMVDGMKKEIEKLKSRNTELQAQAEELRKKADELPPPPPPADNSKTDELSAQIEKLTAKNKELEKDKKDFDKKKETLEQEAQGLRGKNAQLEKITNEYKTKNADLNSKISDLEEKVGKAADAPKEILSELNKQIEELETQNEELESKLEEAEKKGGKKKGGDDKELKKLEKQIKELEKDKKDLEEKLASAAEAAPAAGGDEELEKIKIRLGKYEDMVERMKEKYPDFGNAMQKILLQAELDKRLGKL